MNAFGDWRFVYDEDIQAFGGVKARQQAMSADGEIGKTWLASTLFRLTFLASLPA